jgi:hypothetical protein
MSNRKKVDRLYVDKKDLDDWKRLKEKDSPFTGSDNKDIFIAAMIVGYHEGSKIELKSKEGYFFSDNLKPEELALIRAIAVSEKGSLNVLLDEQKVYSIAEQYAAGGVKLLKNKIFSGEYGSYARKLESDLLRQYEKNLQHKPEESKTLEDIIDIPVADLIVGGETDKVEFKSSFIWDYKKMQASREIKMETATAISSFMNTDGGFLLIGIDDDKNIIGLENDLAQTHKNLDKFQLTFTNSINTYLGKVNRLLISIRFDKAEGKDVAIIRVKPSPHPVYLKCENNKEEFYIRSGNSSQRLDISDATQYIKEHWPDLR